MEEFKPISKGEDQRGLVWHAQVTPQYLAELQTGIIPQLVHLVIFDVDKNYKVVYDRVQAYEPGDVLDAGHQVELQKAVKEALEALAENE